MKNKKSGLNLKPLTNLNLDSIKKSEHIHPKMSEAIVRMIVNDELAFYGEFLQMVNFWEISSGTCGVNADNKGLNYYWNKQFVESLSMQEMIFVHIHECFHLLLDHQKRSIGYDHKISNIAKDMIINSIIVEDLIMNEKIKHIDIVKDQHGLNSGVFLEKTYQDPEVFEILYSTTKKNFNNWKDKNALKLNKPITITKNGDYTIDGKTFCSECNQDINITSTVGDETCPKCNKKIPKIKEVISKESPIIKRYGPFGRTVENKKTIHMYEIDLFFENIEQNKGQTLDIHFDDEVPEEVKRQIVENNVERLKQRGLLTGNVEQVLNKLVKKRKDHLKEIKRVLSNDVLGFKKEKSITRPNRRDIQGIKGNRKYSVAINCILDTSGSMSGDFEKVLSYIFQNDIKINLIQVDTDIKDFTVVKKKSELQKMPIKGLGGTTLTPGLNYIASEPKLNKYPTVILTDGYTDSLDFTGIKNNVLIISSSVKCPEVEHTKSIKVKQILIDGEYK